MDSDFIEAGVESVEVQHAELDMKTTEGALSERSANARRIPTPQKESVPIISEEEAEDVQNMREEAPSWDFSYFKESCASPPKPKSRIPLQVGPKHMYAVQYFFELIVQRHRRTRGRLSKQ